MRPSDYVCHANRLPLPDGQTFTEDEALEFALPFFNEGSGMVGSPDTTCKFDAPDISDQMREFLGQPLVFKNLLDLGYGEIPVPANAVRNQKEYEKFLMVHGAIAHVMGKDGDNLIDIFEGSSKLSARKMEAMKDSGLDDLDQWWKIWHENKEDILTIISQERFPLIRVRAMMFVAYLFGNRPLGSTWMFWSNIHFEAATAETGLRPDHLESRRREERYLLQNNMAPVFVRALEIALSDRFHPDYADPTWLVRVMQSLVREEGPSLAPQSHKLRRVLTTLQMLAVMFLDSAPLMTFDFSDAMLTLLDYLTHLYPSRDVEARWRRLNPQKPLRGQFVKGPYTPSDMGGSGAPANHVFFLQIAVEAVELISSFIVWARSRKVDTTEVETKFAEFLDRHLVYSNKYKLNKKDLRSLRTGDLTRYTFYNLTRITCHAATILSDKPDFKLGDYRNLAIHTRTYRINDTCGQDTKITRKGKVKNKRVSLSKLREKGKGFGNYLQGRNRGYLDLWRKERYCRVCFKLCLGKGKANKLQSCSQCKVASYCCRECQKKDWKHGHRSECGETKEFIGRILANLQEMEFVCFEARGRIAQAMSMHHHDLVGTAAIEQHRKRKGQTRERDLVVNMGMDPDDPETYDKLKGLRLGRENLFSR